MDEDRLKEMETEVNIAHISGDGKTMVVYTHVAAELIAEVRRLQRDAGKTAMELSATRAAMTEVLAEVAELAHQRDGLQHAWEEARAEVERLLNITDALHEILRGVYP
jgi:uncharacterized coiled-coil DUF342 family protein